MELNKSQQQTNVKHEANKDNVSNEVNEAIQRLQGQLSHSSQRLDALERQMGIGSGLKSWHPKIYVKRGSNVENIASKVDFCRRQEAKYKNITLSFRGTGQTTSEDSAKRYFEGTLDIDDDAPSKGSYAEDEQDIYSKATLTPQEKSRPRVHQKIWPTLRDIREKAFNSYDDLLTKCREIYSDNVLSINFKGCRTNPNTDIGLCGTKGRLKFIDVISLNDLAALEPEIMCPEDFTHIAEIAVVVDKLVIWHKDWYFIFNKLMYGGKWMKFICPSRHCNVRLRAVLCDYVCYIEETEMNHSRHPNADLPAKRLSQWDEILKHDISTRMSQ